MPNYVHKSVRVTNSQGEWLKDDAINFSKLVRKKLEEEKKDGN